MRGSTILAIPPQEQAWMRAELRHARRGCVLTVHVLLLCAAGRTPTESATLLFCSRTSGYRIVNAYHTQWRNIRLDQPLPPVGGLTPSVRRSLLALLKRVPAVYGGAARGGVVPPWPRNSRSSAGSWSRPRPYGAGCLRWAGCGNGHSW